MAGKCESVSAFLLVSTKQKVSPSIKKDTSVPAYGQTKIRSNVVLAENTSKARQNRAEIHLVQHWLPTNSYFK